VLFAFPALYQSCQGHRHDICCLHWSIAYSFEHSYNCHAIGIVHSSDVPEDTVPRPTGFHPRLTFTPTP
jgi:hypothetical protein